MSFSLDYSLDPSDGLFNSTAAGIQARAAMERATQVFADRIVDNLTAISPGGGNAWSPSVVNPSTGSATAAPLSGVGANVIKVYVGSRSLAPPDVGIAYAGTATATGTQAFVNNAASRGQAGALAATKTDFGPWGGSISFDWDTNWYFGLTPGGLTSNKADFLSIATHELAHLLGFSIGQPSYAALVSGTNFTGPKARTVNGGVAPVVNGSHWTGMSGTVGPNGPAQTALMNPGLPLGARRHMTLLDWAALDDLGWSLAMPGDANADGWVNFADFQILEAGFHRPDARWSRGDFNEDGAVDTADFKLLVANYGKFLADGAPAAVASAAEQQAMSEFAQAWGVSVPEPGMLGLAGGGVAVMAMRRRRRRR